MRLSRMQAWLLHLERASKTYEMMPSSKARRGRLATWKLAWRMTKWL